MADASPEATEPEAEAPPVDNLRDGIVARLSELHPDAVVGSHVDPGVDLTVRVTPESWVAIAESLRYVLGARYFAFLSALDWLPSPFGRYLDTEVDKFLDPPEAKEPKKMESGVAGGDTRFQVFMRLTNQKEQWGITVKADCLGPDETPHIDSLTKVFAGADWHEREAWEMYGITFVGHPHLRHIYLPTGFEGNPGRKDFPLIARIVKPWPGVVDVEPFPPSDEDQADEGQADDDQDGDRVPDAEQAAAETEAADTDASEASE